MTFLCNPGRGNVEKELKNKNGEEEEDEEKEKGGEEEEEKEVEEEEEEEQARAGNKMRLAGCNRRSRRFRLNCNGRTYGRTDGPS